MYTMLKEHAHIAAIQEDNQRAIRNGKTIILEIVPGISVTSDGSKFAND